MFIFSLLVLIVFSPLCGMIVQKDNKDNYDIVLKMGDGSLSITEEELSRLYIADLVKEVKSKEAKKAQKIIDLTGKTFYEGEKEYTVTNVSRTIAYLEGKLDPSGFSVKEQCELFSCVDSLVSNSCCEKIYPLGNLIYQYVKKGVADLQTENLFFTISKEKVLSSGQKVHYFHDFQDFPFKGKLLHNVLKHSSIKNKKVFTLDTQDLGAFPFKFSTIITIDGLPNLFIEQGRMNVISRIIKSSRFLKELNIHGIYMPTLFKETLTNPTPPDGCVINLDNNKIRQIEPDAVGWWNNGTLSLKGNSLTPESLRILYAATSKIPLLKAAANTVADSLKWYKNSPNSIIGTLGVLWGSIALLPYSEITGFVQEDVYLRGSYVCGASLLSGAVSSLFAYLHSPENAYLSEKNYLPLTLILDNPAQNIPLD